MRYGHEKDFKSFEEFSVIIVDYIDYYNIKLIQVKQNGCLL
ncbi:IS3 family transposase [Treponema sp.]